MIQTFYSNSFEILQAAFVNNISFDLKDKYDASNIFEAINVIVPSMAISDRLQRALADTLGASPGIKYLMIQQWLNQYITKSLSLQFSSLDWLVWKVLKEKKEKPSKDPREQPLNHYLSTLDETGIIEFARHLSSLFVTYGTYRFDWLMSWSGQKLDPKIRNMATNEERINLRKDPNYDWQSLLWREIVETDQNAKTANKESTIVEWLAQMVKNLEKINVNKLGSNPIHLFMPFILPPVVLPLIKAFSADNTPTLYLYILNPCSEYWFEALPKKLFDWKQSTHPSSVAQNYLCSNAASTRAMIDRLFNFLTDVSTNVFESQDAEQYAQFQDSERRPRKRQFINDPTEVSTERVDIGSAYIAKGSSTFLNRFQDSILKLDNSLLPTEPDPEDESLRILQAPSFTRELEAFVDILHHWLSDQKKQLNPSDVLVVVPNIQQAAPYIEGVMRQLPENMALPWKIVGQPLTEQNQMTIACIGLLNLLQSNFSIDEFFGWLELPSVQSAFRLSLNDLTILRTWLDTAGYHFGLNTEQLKEEHFDDEDCSLDLAIERLTLGFFMDSEKPVVFNKTFSIHGDEDGGFDLVTDESGRLLITITNIFNLLNKIWAELREHNFEFTAKVWSEKLDVWFQKISEANDSSADDSAFAIAFKDFKDTLSDAFGDMDESIELSVIANELATELGSTIEPIHLTGAITFAPIQLMRGLPFKVIGALGFDEESGFPGNPKFEEFDLMKNFRRRADRDSRKDNKAIFLDTMLSAKENLIISYTVGTEPQADNNPSIVIENFKNYFLSHAREVARASIDTTKSSSYAKENVDRLWNSLVSRVPLNKFSAKNFDARNISKSAENSNNFRPFWLSPRQDIKESLELARKNNFSGTPKLFADIGIPKESLPSQLTQSHYLQLHQLIDFIIDPDTWTLKTLGLNSYSSEEQTIPIIPNSPLYESALYGQLYSRLREGCKAEEVLAIEETNPKNGLKAFRKEYLSDYVEQTKDARKLIESRLKEFDGSPHTQRLCEDAPYDVWPNTIVKIVDTVDEVYSKGKSYFWVNAYSSKRKLRKMLLRQIFWKALGKDVSQFLLDLKEKPDIVEVYAKDIDKDTAFKILEVFLHLFKNQLQRPYGLISPTPFGSTKKASPLLRGVENAEELEQLSEDLYKKLNEMLIPNKIAELQKFKAYFRDLRKRLEGK